MQEPFRLLIDEDVPDPAVELLERLGYSIEIARVILGRGIGDEVVAEQAIGLGAVVVTRNVRHFWAIARQRAFQRMSYIGMGCESALITTRLTELADVIDFLLTRCALQDRSLNLEITSETFSVKDR